MSADIDFSKLFEQTFDHAPIGIALVSPDGTWMRVNKSLCTLIGYTSAELLTKRFQDITYPDDLNLDLKHVKDVLSDKSKGYQIEKRYITKSGDIVWVRLSVSLVRDSANKPAFFISQIESIQAQKELEFELHATADNFNHIINTITDPIFVKDRKHRSVLVNAALCEFMGHTETELLGNYGEDYFPVDEISNMYQNDEELFTTGKALTYEEDLTDGKNIVHSVLVRKRLYTREDGEKFIVGTFHDITARKQREEELNAKNEELEAMNNMMMGRELRMIELKKEITRLKNS